MKPPRCSCSKFAEMPSQNCPKHGIWNEVNPPPIPVGRGKVKHGLLLMSHGIFSKPDAPFYLVAMHDDTVIR